MWKVLAGIVMATAVVVASVILYPMRHRLFRPDFSRVGGTRLVLDVKGDADDIAAAFRQRFDPTEGEGIVIRAEGGGVEVDVPNARSHDENLERVKRLAGRVGRFRVGVLAHDQDDAEAVAAARKWLAVPANRKALEDAYTKGDPFPDFPGRHKGTGAAAPSSRYEWVSVDGARASVVYGLWATPHGGPAREHFPLYHEVPHVPGGRGIIFLTLLRLTPEDEGLTNTDLIRPKVIEEQFGGGGRYSTRLMIRVEGDGRRRIRDLVVKQETTRAPIPRRVALVIDSDVLFYFDHGTLMEQTSFEPVMDTPSDGHDVIALLRSPLPAGARVKVEKEQTLPGR